MAMTAEQMQLTMIRGMLVSLPAAEQAKVEECAQKIRALAAEYGDLGVGAVALVGAEIAARSE